MGACMLTIALLGFAILHGGKATSGSGSGSSGLNIDTFSGSGSGIDIPNELVSLSYRTLPVVSSSSSLPWPSTTQSEEAMPHSTTEMEPTPTPTPSPPPITLEEAKQLAISITMDVSLDMWTPTLEATFKLSLVNAINSHCATRQCGSTTAARKRSLLVKRAASFQNVTVDDIVILTGYPKEVTVDGVTSLDVQFYVKGMEASSSSSGGTTAGTSLSKEAVMSAVMSFQTDIAQSMGVSILGVTSAAPTEEPLEDTGGLSSDALLLAVLPGTLAGGFVVLALIAGIAVLIILWAMKRNRAEVLPVKVVAPTE